MTTLRVEPSVVELLDIAVGRSQVVVVTIKVSCVNVSFVCLIGPKYVFHAYSRPCP